MNKSKPMKKNRDNEWATRDECYAEFMNAIVLQAVTDWKDGWKRLQKNPKDTQAENLKCSSESFFFSEWYKHLCEYPAKDLMTRLPDLAKAELLETTKRKYINAYKMREKLKPKKNSKAKQKKLKGALFRMIEAEEDMRSKWFTNLYNSVPEEMIEDCELIAEQELAKEAEWSKLSDRERIMEISRLGNEAKARKKLNRTERS